MAFMDRARALYQRGDAVRAAFVLAEGIKRDPSAEEAVHRFLQIYVEDIGQPGLEQELVRVVETQPNTRELLDIVTSELRSRQHFERLTFLTRVTKLRERAARAREHLAPGSAGPPAQAAAPEPARQKYPSSTAAAAKPARPAPQPQRRPRKRRRSAADQLVPQGVLELGHPRPPREDDWSRFQGLTGKQGSDSPQPPVSDRPRKRPKSLADVRQQRATAPTPDAPPKTAPAQTAAKTAPVIAAPKPPPVKKASPTKAPEETPRMPVLPEAIKPGCTRELNFEETHIEETAEHMAVRPTPPSDDGDFDIDVASDQDAILDLEGSDEWSFGDPIETDIDGASAVTPPPLDPHLEQRIRSRARRATRSGPPIVDWFSRGISALASGRRGLVLLVLVGVLGAFGAGYRACSGLVQTELTEADDALAAADGDSLVQAVKLYQDNLGTEHNALTERLDLTRGLLALDYGHEVVPLEYPIDEALSVYGGAAVAISLLVSGSPADAREAALTTARTYPNDWLAHWTLGRICVGFADWERAEDAFERAREIDDSAVLPIVSLLSLALRAGRQDRAQTFADALSAINSEHPMVSISGPLATYGVDPVGSAAHRLEVVLPDPEERTLSLREIELVTYVRARQALATGDLDSVVRILRQLRTVEGVSLGVRVNLLDAVLAARNYQLDFALSAIDRASSAAPEDCPAQLAVNDVATAIFADLGRPDLALAHLEEHQENDLTRARLSVDIGAENTALTLLGRLMDEAATRPEALRTLVDFHLRRGVPDRARLRSGGLASSDQHFARARIAADEGRWNEAREQADEALRLHPDDFQSLTILAHALAHLGVPEQAAEKIDAFSSNYILMGRFDRLRLEVLTIYGRAPRETIVEFLGSLENVEPTSVLTLAALALGYEAIGDLERSRELAQEVLSKEPNNRGMHALLGRLLHQVGDLDDSQRHLRSYLALAPETEPTDWARALLVE